MSDHPPVASPDLSQLWRLEGRYALVTGASRGIGLAVARILLERGAQILLVARGLAGLKAARDQLAAEFPAAQIQLASADLSTAGGIDHVAQVCAEHFPQLDVLINNAGTNIRKPALAYQEEEYQHILNTNLHSVFRLSMRLHPLLRRGQQPSVVNVSSVAGLTHLRTGAPYAMTKAAIVQLTKNLAAEWATDGIRVNAIAPWYIDTPLAAQVLKEGDYLAQVLQRTPLQRIGQVNEAAAAAVFLALSASGYITGQTLAVDGGFTIYGF